MILPKPAAACIASAAICADEQCMCLWVVLLSNMLPPFSDALNCKLRRIMTHANIYKTIVFQKLINAILDCTPVSVQPDKAKKLAKNKVVVGCMAYEKDVIFERNQDICLE